MRRIPSDTETSGAIRLRPVLREKRCAFGRQPRVVLHQAFGELLLRRVVTQRSTLFQLIDPLRVAARCLRGSGWAQAKAFEIDDRTYTLWPSTGIHQCDVGSHAVTYQPGRRLSDHVVQNELDIGQVIRVPVAINRCAIGPTKSPPIRGNDSPSATERI